MRLFVGGIPHNWTEAELKAHFNAYGPVFAEIITDRFTGKNKGFGFVEIPDREKALEAIKAQNGRTIDGRRTLRVQRDNKPPRPNRRNSGESKPGPRTQALPNVRAGTKFPYRFVERPAPLPESRRRKPPGHHQLEANRFDIAFDVTWEAVTPVAANPCSAPEVPPSNPRMGKSEYGGYNLRWLMVDDRLALSPFTVKSAVANAYANIMGSCFRVVDKQTGHKSVEQGSYPYDGAWKRYRVSQDGKSRPGIVMGLEPCGQGIRIRIQPCSEYYYDDNPKLPFALKKYDEVHAVVKRDRKYKPAIIGDLSLGPKPLGKHAKALCVQYFGPYSYGMNNSYNGKHNHRFFVAAGDEVQGTLAADRLGATLKQLEARVYMGQYRNHKDKRWYEDLSDLKKGDWVYYQTFNNQVTCVGKNFLFKALFCHGDTVPEGQAQCSHMEQLCPRCAMFGMTAAEGGQSAAVGYRGRFKSCALVCDLKIKEQTAAVRIPVEKRGGLKDTRVEIKEWVTAEGRTISRQVLMPLQGPPKPNRRDVNGYFDPDSGCLKGAKAYRHASSRTADFKGLDKLIQTVNGRNEQKKGKLVYTHRLRNYAQVCDSALVFRGTLGADNASPDEIAALLALLDHRLADHGFKIGLGKPVGLGTMRSRIHKIWIRRAPSYQWEAFSMPDEERKALPAAIAGNLPVDLGQALADLLKVTQLERRLNTMQGMEDDSTAYPDNLRKYWEQAAKSGLNE